MNTISFRHKTTSSTYVKEYHVEIDSRNNTTEQIVMAVSESVRDVMTRASVKPGEQIVYETLKVDTDVDRQGNMVAVRARVSTIQRPLTLEEFKDAQVDLIRAIKGIDRNG